MPEKKTQPWLQLIELRKAADLSQYELARRLNIGRSALGNWEQGERQPDFETTKKLADFFNVSVDYLLGREAHLPLTSAEQIPVEWREAVAAARKEGFTPEQMLEAMQLMETLQKQQQALQKKEREA